MKLRRRQFIKMCGLTAATGGVLANGCASPSGVRSPRSDMIDVNVSLSHWPTRRLPLDEPSRLASHLRRLGVRQAWAGTFDALLHKDLAAANERLAKACHANEFFLPVGAVNPMLPDWEEELRRCREVHHFRVVRLHPNYHGYDLKHESFARLLELCAQWGVGVQIAAAMEDIRMQHPLLRVQDVDLTPLPRILKGVPRAQVMLLNWFRAAKPELLRDLREHVWVDVAMVEGVGGLDQLLSKMPPERICFGSHAPFYYPESALLKLRESFAAEVTIQQVRSTNAHKFPG